jgi:hypothetical protein
LQAARITAWLDRNSIRFGALLGDELLEAIKDSRVAVLLWSKAAARSRWVATEILTAYHTKRFIVPVALDKARVPMFLQNNIRIDLHRSGEGVFKDLVRAVKEAPSGANPVPPFMGTESSALQQFVSGVNQLQMAEIACLQSGDLKKANQLHTKVQKVLRSGEKAWRHQASVLSLAGYHFKNGYMLKHDAELNAGRLPPDPLLHKAQKKFFETLFVNPDDPSSLNGQANVMFFDRELKAAEFFHLCAIDAAKALGSGYPAAESDLARVRLLLQAGTKAASAAHSP